MARSLQQQYDAVDAAIEALENGGHTSYSIGGRSVTKLDYNSLVLERARLWKEIQRESYGNSIRGAKIIRPRP